jgi:hypothetical protein
VSKRKQGNSDCAELPRICLIDSSIEARFAEILSRRTKQNLAALRGPRINARVLREATRRMTDVDLDVAWRAALRGDSQVVEARVLPHVDVRALKRSPKGSPWRMSGWLSRRTT